jgi:hypothetical protein
MPDQIYPKDENLRLILSTDQEQWLAGRIKDNQAFVWAMTILLLLSVSWLSAVYAGVFSQYDAPECFSLVGDTQDNQQLRAGYLADGLKPCPTDESGEAGTDWENVRGMVTVAAWFLVLLSSLGLLRGLHQLRMFKGYLTDHQAFLKKYNRLDSAD